MQKQSTLLEPNTDQVQNDETIYYSFRQSNIFADFINEQNSIYQTQQKQSLPSQNNQNKLDVKDKELCVPDSQISLVSGNFSNTFEKNIFQSFLKPQNQGNNFLSSIEEKSNEYNMTEIIIIETLEVQELNKQNFEIRKDIHRKEMQNELLRLQIQKVKFQKRKQNDLNQYYRFIVNSKDQQLLSIKKSKKSLIQKSKENHLGYKMEKSHNISKQKQIRTQKSSKKISLYEGQKTHINSTKSIHNLQKKQIKTANNHALPNKL